MNKPSNQPTNQPSLPKGPLPGPGSQLTPSSLPGGNSTKEEVEKILAEAQQIGFEEGVKKAKSGSETGSEENSDSDSGKKENSDSGKKTEKDSTNTTEQNIAESIAEQPKPFEEMSTKEIIKALKKAGIKAKYGKINQEQLRKLYEAAVLKNSKKIKKTTIRDKTMNKLEKSDELIRKILTFEEFHEEKCNKIDNNIKKALWELWVGFGSNIPRNLYKTVRPIGSAIDASVRHPLRVFSNLSRIPTSLLRTAGNVIKAPFRMLDEAVGGIKGFLDTTAEANKDKGVLLEVTPEILSKIMSIPKFFTEATRSVTEMITSPTVGIDEYIKDIQTR